MNNTKGRLKNILSDGLLNDLKENPTFAPSR
nr:MAG TPA: hypothetical protein [Caudoviricetes sp.]